MQFELGFESIVVKMYVQRSFSMCGEGTIWSRIQESAAEPPHASFALDQPAG